VPRTDAESDLISGFSRHYSLRMVRELPMSIYDEYQIVINEAQRRVIMRALTNAMASDRQSTKGGALSRPTQDEYMQLVRLFGTIRPSVRK
jgi:hypothetical protein